MEEFKPKVPLLVALRTKGMNDRHWKDIREKSHIDIKPNESDFTFKKILGMNLMDHCEFIVEVGDRAGKEYSIEQKLNEMNVRWEEISF